MENVRQSYFKEALKTRAISENKKIIEGYFVVFNAETKLWEDVFEMVVPGAVDSVNNNDVRVLFNHDSNFVLGRKSAGTANFKIDEKGLWGSVEINVNDSVALDIYSRVERGDITGCSYGYYPIKESFRQKEDGSDLWLVEEADVVEVSICAFPQYEQTEIQARQKDFNNTKKMIFKNKKEKVKRRLEGVR